MGSRLHLSGNPWWWQVEEQKGITAGKTRVSALGKDECICVASSLGGLVIINLPKLLFESKVLAGILLAKVFCKQIGILTPLAYPAIEGVKEAINLSLSTAMCSSTF